MKDKYDLEGTEAILCSLFTAPTRKTQISIECIDLLNFDSTF